MINKQKWYEYISRVGLLTREPLQYEIEISQPWNILVFTMGIRRQVRWHLYVETPTISRLKLLQVDVILQHRFGKSLLVNSNLNR